jgi:hypothetical protein
MSSALFPDPSQKWSRSSYKWGSEVLKGKRPLPEVSQDDLIQGVKYARLGLDDYGKPCFYGTASMGGPYYTESRAVCGKGGQDSRRHRAPQPDCECGFYVPVRKESALAVWSSVRVRLEVEIGGRVLDCHHGEFSDPAWGYRAEWQRVLSVTFSTECGGASYGSRCGGKALWLCTPPGISGKYPSTSSMLIQSCIVHMRKSSRVIARPVSWLREQLRTEIRPGDLRDELPPEERDRLGVLDEVARQQYPVVRIMESVTFPANPRYGDLFRICVDVTSKMTYEFAYMLGGGWQVNAIYHPMLGPWGWGAPDG